MFTNNLTDMGDAYYYVKSKIKIYTMYVNMNI